MRGTSHPAPSSASTTTIETNNVKWVASAVFVLAGAGLALQVTLTRIFSIIFQYHFVFLVVSLAILGLGLGAAAGYFALRSGWTKGGARAITVSALILAPAFPVAAWLLTTVNSADLTASAVMASAVPFLLIGWTNALIYAQYCARSNFIYGADLIGAAVGLVVAPALLTALGPFGAAVSMGAFGGLAAALLAFGISPGQGRWRVVAVFARVALAALTLVNRAAGVIAFDPHRVAVPPPDKTMLHILNNPAQNARVVATQWGPFAQVDVVATDDPGARFVFTDAGAGSIMVRYDPQAEVQDFEWLDREVTYLPFKLGPVKDTLVIGAGAGYDVFMARRAGAESVTAVEINPAIVEVTRAQADYNGGILDLPGVSTVITDGRNFVDRSDAQFDLIYLNVVYSQAATPGVSSLVENHAFTVEALRAYWNRLTDGGRIAFVTHNGLEGVRLLMTALTMLEGEGMALPEAANHTALVMTPNQLDPTTTPSALVIARQSLTAEDGQKLNEEAVGRLGMQALFIPHVFEDTLQELLDGSTTLETYFARNDDYNIFPTTDNRPFFYHLDPGLPAPLDALLKLCIFLVGGYFIVAAALQPKQPRHDWTRINLLCYFAFLGVGFLLAEVAIQQRFRLLLGDPVLSMAVTVGALLLGGGAGSLFGGRLTSSQVPRAMALAAAGVGAWLAAAALVYPALVALALPAELPVRVAVTMVAVLPLGFLMGVLFPGGLRLGGEADPAGVPLFWGMNAVASTLGAALATALALLVGFHLALLAGAAVYLVVAALVRFPWRRTVVVP